VLERLYSAAVRTRDAFYGEGRTMNYERLVNRLRSDPRIFTADDDHKIHRILRKAIRRKVAAYPPAPVGRYSGLTADELRRTGTGETDWF
jgi:hypothetical protein